MATMRFRFVHAADLHLDTPFQGIAEADARVAQAMRDASLEAWDALVALTLAEDAAFLVLAGDIYDGPRRGLRAQLRFWRGVRRLCDAGVQVLCVHGNHDPQGAGWSAVAAWPAGTVWFPADRVGSAAVVRDGRRLATVHGISFGRPEEPRNLAAGFRRGPEPGLHVAVLHANVGGDREHGNYAPCTPADLRAAGMDYWALGHVHRRRLVLQGEPAWAAYPGTPQGRSPAPGELGPKGALVLTCDEERGVLQPPRFVALDRARCVRVLADLSGAGDVASAIARIGERLRQLRADPEQAGRGLLVRLSLGGAPAGAWTAQLPRLLASGELLDQVRELAEGWEPFLWCESLRLDLQMPLPRQALAGRGDFAAELLACADELAGDPAALVDLLRELDGELPPSAAAVLAGGGGAAADPQELLAAAEQACLRLLLDDAEAGA